MLYRTENPHGGDIYEGNITLDFSANTNPFGTPNGVLAAMSAALCDIHRYPDPYCRELSAAISDFEGLPREYILCGSGAAELIYCFCEAAKPESAVLTAPTFSEYESALNRVGCKTERYNLNRGNDFDLDDGFLDFLEEKLPQAVFLCNPNNPTGRSISPLLLESILHFCGERDIRLFFDECFLDLSDSAVSMKGFLREYPQLFILKAFTKSYGMAGVRLGYCLSGDFMLLTEISRVVQPWNVSSLAQAAGIAALKEKEFLALTRKTVFAEREWMRFQLEALGFYVCPSSANYLLFFGGKNLDTELKKQGIAIRNCDNYHGLSEGWYRTAVRLHEQNERLISAVRGICGKE